jgi:hypothetical protein
MQGHVSPAMLGQNDVLKMQAQLFRKIFTVVGKLENVKKSGYNSHQKYSYSTEQDLIDSVRQLLIDNQILILTDSETKEVVKISKPDGKGNVKESLVTVVNTRHTFCDVETGYTYNLQSTGTGWDETDKGSFKAITGAMKYFISKNFLVPGEDDAENDGVTAKTTPVQTPTRTGFNRPVAANVKPEETEVKTTPPSNVGLVITPNIQPPAQATQTAKPSFGRRTQTTKTEPNFP